MNGQTRRKSDLATIEKISPNKSIPRTKSIRRLTPHCVAGNLSVEATLGLAAFRAGASSPASTGYAIGSDGRIGLGVEETNRPWTSSSSANDNEAITFEIANNGGAPDWRMSDAAINAWLNLAVEICRFYGYKKVNYQPKPANVTGSANVENWIKSWANSDEMIITLHNWYANKACPGPYFIRQLPWLVREMNKRLQNSKWEPEVFIGEGGTFPTLSKGASGDSVKLAQQRLNIHGVKPALTVDGSFGNLTETAVKAFQTQKGLKADGVIGTTTWSELSKEPTVQAVTPPVQAPVTKPTTGTSYLIKSAVQRLNIRKSANINSAVVKTLVEDNNKYTITQEADGPIDDKGTIGKWGKLKSGIGWVALQFTKRV